MSMTRRKLPQPNKASNMMLVAAAGVNNFRAARRAELQQLSLIAR
jgi:hypothetical protein